MRAARLFALAIAFATIVAARASAAHGVATAYLEITETAPGHALARLVTSIPVRDVEPIFPANCAVDARGDGVYVLACEGSLEGAIVGVDGLGGAIGEAAIHVRLAGGRTFAHLVRASDPRWRLPPEGIWHERLASLVEYARVGALHVLRGSDHLLFLLLLVLTLERVRAVLVAETAFTLSHTASFAATALGLVHVSSAAAEACIALSLVLIALDVGEPSRRPSDRAAALLAFAFGLVHGLGFAGGLREIGMPEEDAGAALAGFGLGVEVGQVAFLLIALAALGALRRARWYPRAALFAAYAVGGVASYWLIVRVVACVRGA